jgi:di/tricarboxylate transporter
MTVTLFVLAPIVGGRANQIGERPLVVTGLLLQAAGCGWMALIATPDLPYRRRFRR